MGVFKQIKDLKNVVAQAPGAVGQAQEMAEQAQQMQTAYDGWNARFEGNKALSVQLGSLYQQARAL